MIEKEVVAEVNGNSIAGTFCLPNGKDRCPIVLFIHGSGALDRNENAQGVKLNIFNTIAHYLVNNGIGSLRYDKRGCGQSTGDYYSASHTDLVEDGHSLIDYLVQSDFCDKNDIYLLGHSEGSIIVPQLSHANRVVAGIILLCPFAQSLEQVLREQAKQLEQDIQKEPGWKGKLARTLVRLAGGPVVNQEKLIVRIKQSNTPIIKYWFKTVNAKWFRELFELDVTEVFRQVRCPMLVIGGSKDIQCSPSDVEFIESLSSHSVDAHIIPNMTHILRCDIEEPSFFSYKRLLKQDIEDRVLQLTRQWLERRIVESSAIR